MRGYLQRRPQYGAVRNSVGDHEFYLLIAPFPVTTTDTYVTISGALDNFYDLTSFKRRGASAAANAWSQCECPASSALVRQLQFARHRRDMTPRIRSPFPI
jgi:hypothetical protein